MLDRAGELAFRIRCRPRGLAHREPHLSAQELDRAIGLGARFLHEQQRSDGCLSGFLLYPGASTTWLTAHVAFVVEEMPGLEGLCRRAAEFLKSVGPDDNGWGFNRRVAPDCDSTAQALMVLSRFGVPVENFLLQNLVSAQLPCGGFPTYPRPAPHGDLANGWHAAHPEVSAVVIEALRRVGGYESILERCLNWLKARLDCGLLPSYWWSGYHYGLWVQARTGLLTAEATQAVEAMLDQATGVPHLPFVLTAATGLDVPEETLLSAARLLLLEQYADGSWACKPCLRVTSQKWFHATASAPGIITADKRRVFSTAHSVAALFRVRKRFFD